MGLNMSEGWRRAWWPIVKALLAAVILGAVGWQFYADLRRLDWDDLHVQPAWLMLCGLLYLVGLGFSAWFWRLLLRTFDQHPRPLAVVRAYYIGHLGKYVPGKAWALFLRGALVQGANTRLSVAVVTAFYEVLTTMASGALLAAVIFIVRPPVVSGLTWSPLFTGVFLLALLAVPLFPAVFNRVVGRLAKRFEKLDAFRQPRVNARTLASGLAITALCWPLLGLSVVFMLWAVLPDAPAFSLATWAHVTAAVGLAYVAGFLAIVLPSGVGVREYVLLRLLASEGTEALIALTVLLLRVVWTAAELFTAGVLWWFPGPRPALALAEIPAEPAPASLHCQASGFPYNGPRTKDHGPPA